MSPAAVIVAGRARRRVFAYAAAVRAADLAGTFARASVATYRNVIAGAQYGMLKTAGVGVLREWIHDADGSGIPTTLLELARTNGITQSDDASLWPTLTACGAVKDLVGPDFGANSASTITATGAGAIARVVTTTNGAANKTQALSVFVKKTGANDWALVGDTSGAAQHRVYINLATGALGATVGSVSRARTPVWANGWWRLELEFFEVNAAATRCELRPCQADGGNSVAGDSVGMFCAQHEKDGVMCTSPIQTAGAVATRAADLLTFPWPSLIEASTVYLRHVELGTIWAGTALGSPRWWQIGNAINQAPRRYAHSQSGGAFNTAHQDSAALILQASTLVNPAVGVLMEHAAVMRENGAVYVVETINGGAEATTADNNVAGSGLVSAKDQAWSSPTRLMVNGNGGFQAAADGMMGLRSLVIARGVQSLRTMRAL